MLPLITNLKSTYILFNISLPNLIISLDAGDTTLISITPLPTLKVSAYNTFEEILVLKIFAPEYLNLKAMASVSLALASILFKTTLDDFFSFLTRSRNGIVAKISRGDG